ncbi:suppressor of fused domain protein [Actinoplanes sp. NPDC051494]|uniref:suppressor of fused domain protein n=1 Tax=Actinoplanes sp. NPDC051494 TaxID=3363907 RepID=UPI0037BB1DD3
MIRLPGRIPARVLRRSAARRFGFTGFLVPESGEPIMPPILVDELRVNVLMAAPLFTDELDYFRDHGTDALWDRMQEADMPMWDPRRESTCHRAR